MPAGARRLGAYRQFGRLKAQYDVEPDPVFALSAFEVARSYGVEIPAWVLGYFDRLASSVGFLAQQPLSKGEIDGQLVRAFGFTSGGAEFTHAHLMFKAGVAGVVSEQPSLPERSARSYPHDPRRGRRLEIAEYVAAYVAMGERESLTPLERRALTAAAKKAARERFGGHISKILEAVRRFPRARDGVVLSLANDLTLCENSGMSRSEAIAAVAVDRGRDVTDIRKALRRIRRPSAAISPDRNY